MDRIASRLGGKLIVAAEQGGLLKLIGRFFRSLTLWLTVIYFVLGAGLCFAMHFVGERNITTAFLIYLPPSLWLLPLAPLMLLGLLFYRRCLMAQIAMGCLLMLWLGYPLVRLSTATGDGGETHEISVMTYNRGQNMSQSLQPFKNATHPDILVFQEAGGRAAGFLHSPDYAEFGHAADIGEFTLLSRYPIKDRSLVPAASLGSARAARFVIDWNGRPISVYVVHLMTPRDVLGFYMRGAFLWGILGVPGTPGAEKRRHYQTFWDQQINDASQIMASVRADANPCILAGDFNAPHVGYIHRMLAAELGDAHAAAGHGFGFTFPGVTRNPLSLGGPWMRIDYIFYDRHWKAVECLTEKKRPSQHRAVMARMRLTGGSSKP
ncbi:endonuclease/exonuclease/phosphatase family protein [Prosthecobacter sp.]|uniref:endonuclease/exonuclease/phosphatase family protein n=1 Tax=Prosthecobacter sp. TaxID=1965333 RepID=UPI00248A7FC3|nr:endonuclease/exonuclease/phosphatase family protein [Prosthecobacter sp.]MDI1310839.1 endonuclease/exonuclease/phosphatase family protein [Prosthecobacter sp.]